MVGEDFAFLAGESLIVSYTDADLELPEEAAQLDFWRSFVNGMWPLQKRKLFWRWIDG